MNVGMSVFNACNLYAKRDLISFYCEWLNVRISQLIIDVLFDITNVLTVLITSR